MHDARRTTHDAQIDFEALLRALAGAQAEFIVVGGVCAVLHGAPVATFDLDLVYSRAGDNLSRLERVLREFNAVYREKPDAAGLDSAGHHLLQTDAGPLDLLGSVVGGERYEELLAHTEGVDLGTGLHVRLLDLPTLIRLKEQLGRDRDRAVLPILKRTLAERGGPDHDWREP